MARSVTIQLSEEDYLYLELCAAKDNRRIAAGIESLLAELCAAKRENRPVKITPVKFRDDGYNKGQGEPA